MPRVGRDTQTWRKLRVQCYQRDRALNAPCHICGQAIDYAAKPSSTPKSYEPDHVISPKLRPDLAEVPENVRAAHMSCNRSKRDKAGIDELGKTSRRW